MATIDHIESDRFGKCKAGHQNSKKAKSVSSTSHGEFEEIGIGVMEQDEKQIRELMAAVEQLKSGYDEMMRKYAILNQVHANNAALTIAACEKAIGAIQNDNSLEAISHLNSLISHWGDEQSATN